MHRKGDEISCIGRASVIRSSCNEAKRKAMQQVYGSALRHLTENIVLQRQISKLSLKYEGRCVIR